MPVTNADLSNSFRRALIRMENARLVPALMGKKTGGASWDFDVPGGRGLKYVRVLQGNDGVTPVQCINEAGVADTGDLPLWIRQDIGARWVIVKERFDA